MRDRYDFYTPLPGSREHGVGGGCNLHKYGGRICTLQAGTSISDRGAGDVREGQRVLLYVMQPYSHLGNCVTTLDNIELALLLVIAP